MSSENSWKLNKYDVPGRNIVWTEGVGQAYPDDVRKVTEYVLEKAKTFSGKKWAYIPGIEKMNPIFDAETQQCFAQMHNACEAAGCVAMAFVSGGMASIKVQSKRHQQKSQAGKLVVEHFRTAEEAMDWLKESFDI